MKKDLAHDIHQRMELFKTQEFHQNVFSISKIPTMVFGEAPSAALPKLLGNKYQNILFIHGRSSWASLNIQQNLEKMCSDFKYIPRFISIHGEPSPEVIDTICASLNPIPDVVVAIGGGSVLDTGKAVAAMLCEDHGVIEFLEGVGNKKPSGRTKPFIACPTTAGTGSEATKNAVISKIGSMGFKKSLRHDEYIPYSVILYPVLSCTCPKDITAAAGLDAATQLFEAYTSKKASPFTQTLCETGFGYNYFNLAKALKNPNDISARSYLALAAYYSGIALANAGLGLVHGLASLIGGKFHIPHGVICAKLFPPVCTRLLHKISEPEFISRIQRLEYVTGATIEDIIKYYQDVADTLPALTSMGFTKAEIQGISAEADNKNSIAILDLHEINHILTSCIDR